MTTAARLDPNTLTPGRILAAAERYGLKLMPGSYFQTEDGRLVGCCPVGALALEVDELIRYGAAAETALAAAGLSRAFTAGMTYGFDDDPEIPDTDHEFNAGFALGRAVRRAVGLDGGEERG